MNDPCKTTLAQLDAYLSRELPEQARQEVERHLESCPRCTAELELRSRVRTQLRAAVRATPIPAGLESRVRQAVRSQPARPRSGLYAVAAAAAIILCAFLLNLLRTRQSPEEAILAKMPAHLAAVMKVGLRDHLQCAVFRKYPRQPDPAAQMASELGAEFAGLAPLIQAKLPANFQIIQAHRCDVAGRMYTHFIIAGGGKLASVIITQARPGEWLSEGIHQAGVDRFQVVGFESHDQLAYVISDLDAQQNLQWAANLAPTLRQYLAARAG